ncbi:C40 family peptidase [Paraflavisolibacter sp. H34]|uniref:C40 family peptidase n=1 Tax=Huijunlia imazamoxiresistens TaxID=3127457 RepID=UPI003016A61C
MWRNRLLGMVGSMVLSSCQLFFRPEAQSGKQEAAGADTVTVADSVAAAKKEDSGRADGMLQHDTVVVRPGEVVHTKEVRPEAVVQFAKTLQGTPYRYGAADPNEGFDCSGFITYVFNHFGISVPRSSIDFTNVGRDIAVEAAQPGDLVLFTGTDSAERFVGHMGIIVSRPGDPVHFIHATSGRDSAVTITPLNPYYKGRYVKTVRVFQDVY